MTIVVGVAAPDGIVLAADSRSTNFPDGAEPGKRHRVISDTAEKLFAICGRFAVATYGEAFIDDSTIAGIMDEFVAHVGAEAPADISMFVDTLGTFFHERYAQWRAKINVPIEEDEPIRIGFLVAGYDTDGVGHIREVTIPGPVVDEAGARTTSTGGLLPRGQTDVINRLLDGVDWDALAAIAEARNITAEIPADVMKAMEELEYKVLYPISVQDAIDLASFLIRTTIDMQRFSDGIRASTAGGVPGCGGQTNVVAVRRTAVEWVSSASLSAHRRPGWAEGAV